MDPAWTDRLNISALRKILALQSIVAFVEAALPLQDGQKVDVVFKSFSDLLMLANSLQLSIVGL